MMVSCAMTVYFGLLFTWIYKLAKKRADETNKLFMIIGDPLNGSFFHRYFTHIILGPPYDYGDVSIDISGCPENKGHSIK